MTSVRPEGIVVLGAPRSGTTLVRRLLDAHPDVACPPETVLLTAAARFLHEQPLDQGVRFGVFTGLATAGFPRDEVLRRVRELVFGSHREHAARAGKRLWAEKTAVDAFHVPAIEELCGEHVRYVGVLRHGLDVALSMKDLTERSGGALPELQAYLAREHRPLVAYARAWADATTAVLDLIERRPDQGVLLRYEDLVADPRGALGPVFAALELPLPDDLVDRAMEVQTVGFGDWRTWDGDTVDPSRTGRFKGISRAMRHELAPMVNPVLERAGYPPVKRPTLPDMDPARRLELAVQLRAARKSDDG